MYAAHAEQKRKENSQLNLKNCLNLVQDAKTDNDRFAALLEIAQNVKENTFTTEDRKLALQAIGLKFLSRLTHCTSLPEHCPSNLYRCIALNLLSVLSVDSYIVVQPEMKDFLHVANDVMTPNSSYNKGKNPNSRVRFEQMCRDSEELVYNVSRHQEGIRYLLESGTPGILVDYVLSEHCQNMTAVLQCLSAIVKNQGDAIFARDPSKFHDVMSKTVDRLGQGSDIREKVEYANILSSILSGTSVVEVNPECEWAIQLTQVLKKLIAVKLSPEDSEAILFLVCSLVAAVGCEILIPQANSDTRLFKAVVARVSVEVYMQLDNIDLENASERYPKLDKVYKLLCSIVQFVAEHGEDADTDSIIVVYRKLVETSEVIMEFLCSVANQEVELPRNHSVVLISVRTLAAMLAEITEDPTPKLLELLPFFNLLCQNVEYSDDVIMEVKNATQAALENIKMMGMNAIEEVELEEEPPTARTESTEAASKTVTKSVTDNLKASSSPTVFEKSSGNSETFTAFENLNIDSEHNKEPTAIPSKAKQHPDHSKAAENCKLDRTEACADAAASSSSSSSLNTTDFFIDLNSKARQENKNDNSQQKKSLPKNEHLVIHLSQDNIDDFREFQASVSTSRSKAFQPRNRKVSFSSKNKQKYDSDDQSEASESQHWRPIPDDCLGFLLPAYAFLITSEEALEIMVQCDTFQTIINFLQKSLSQFLENESSVCPENMTINALSVVEEVYTNSPTTAARLHCFQELFELSVLSVPNLVSLPHPPPLVCLKLVEVSLTAYRLQMRGNKRNSSLPRLKHSQSRFFKAIVEYLNTFYEFKQHKRRPYVCIRKEFRSIWPLAEESWCGSIAGLCTLVRSVEELQDVLVKSLLIPDFLAFLNELNADQHPSKFSDDVKKCTESMFSLIESAADGCPVLCELILHHNGKHIANKFGLSKLARCLQNLSPQDGELGSD